jgi:hypothetical protein
LPESACPDSTNAAIDSIDVYSVGNFFRMVGIRWAEIGLIGFEMLEDWLGTRFAESHLTISSMAINSKKALFHQE